MPSEGLLLTKLVELSYRLFPSTTDKTAATLVINNSTAETDLLVAPAAGRHYEITALAIGGVGANTVTIRDGLAGTIKFKGPTLAGDTVTVVFPNRLLFTSATKITAQLTTLIASDYFVNVYGEVRGD